MASFKTDESFLEKISIGVIGTQQVFFCITATGTQAYRTGKRFYELQNMEKNKNKTNKSTGYSMC